MAEGRFAGDPPDAMPTVADILSEEWLERPRTGRFEEASHGGDSSRFSTVATGASKPIEGPRGGAERGNPCDSRRGTESGVDTPSTGARPGAKSSE